MATKLSSCHYVCVSPALSTSLQSAATVSRIFHPNLLEVACDSVIGLLAMPRSVRFEPFAKACIVENVFDYVRCLSTPSIPLTVTELCTRVVTGLPVKLRPDDKQLDEYRVHAEKRGKKQSVLPVAEKIMNNMRIIDGRVDTSTTYLFVQIVEHMLSSIVQTALNYRSELGVLSECAITSTDIQHIFSLLGTSPVEVLSGKVPLVRRNTDTYEGCLRDLQAFLKTSNWSLSLVTRIFFEPLSGILATLSGESASTSPAATAAAANTDLGRAASSALAVFKMAKSLVGDLNILAEVSDDIFDSTAHLLNYCLQEPAEEDLYQGFAYYAETLFSSDCHQWLSVLSECPKIFFTLRRSHRRMINTIYRQVSLRHMPDLEMRFADPHTCPLCTATAPEPIAMPTSHHLSASGSSGGGGGLFSHSVFRRLSTTKSPTPFTSSSSSGERSPPGAPAAPQVVVAPGAGGSPIHGGGSRTCSQMVIAFRYLLPRLLLMPVYQILYLADLLNELCTFPNQDAQEQAILRDTASMLYKTRKSVAQELAHATETAAWVHTHLPRLSLLLETPLSTKPAFLLPVEARVRLAEVIAAAKNTNSSNCDVAHCRLSVNDYIMSGVVQVRQNPAKAGLSDRVAYLFTDCLLLLKRVGQQRRGCGNTFTNVAMAAAAALTNPSSSNSSTSGSGLILKKGVHLAHFHLIDLGMQVNPDSGEAAFLFELECWRDVIVVSRHHQSIKSDQSKMQPEHPPFSTLSLPKQGSAVNLGALTQTPAHRLSGSSTTLNTLFGDTCATSTTSAGAYISETIVNSSAPAKRIIFSLKTPQEKADWLATLIGIQRKSIFQRYLRELPKQEIPLILPDPEQYCFSKPDAPNNILFEPPRTDSSAEIAVIRAATINKLIERITSHTCFDSRTIRTFLQTYRRYLTASKLVELLIKRFNVPQPDFEHEFRASLANNSGSSTSGSSATDNVRSFSDIASLVPCMELRFNSAYKRRIQYRVLSFIKKWVRNPSYFKVDFADNPDLQRRLEQFLGGIDAVPSLAENVSAILRCLHGDRTKVVQVIRQCAPEKLDLGLALTFDRVRVTNVHPLELARQVTLHEWELYSLIEFCEVNGSEKNWGVNMRRSLDFSNKFLKWLIWSIMSHCGMEDRVLVLQRVLDLLMLFEALGNLQGTQEARAALHSSPVYRLSETFDVLLSKSRAHHRVVLEALRPAGKLEKDLLASPEDYIYDYQHRMHRIDPPAVPFIAVGGQTRLIHLELKLPDYLPGGSEEEPLVNFSKCHQIADLREHYLSFQNIPFNLQPDPVIQDFLKNLDPHALAGVEDEAEFEDLMYQQSLCIQPREGATADLRNFPSAEGSMNRQLTATEVRIGNLLSSTPIDVNMKAGFKEFRQLLAITALSPDAKFDFTTSAMLPSRARCGSLGRGSKHARDHLSASCSASSTEGSSRVSPAPPLETGAPPPLPPKPTQSLSTPPLPPPPLPPSLRTSPMPLASRVSREDEADAEFRVELEAIASGCSGVDYIKAGVAAAAVAAAAPPLPPRATVSSSSEKMGVGDVENARDTEFSPYHSEEHYYFRGGVGGTTQTTMPVERWRCISGRRETNVAEASMGVSGCRLPPPPPPPKSSMHRTSLPPLSDQDGDNVAPELPSRTSCPPRSQVSSPTAAATAFGANPNWNPPPLPPKKHVS
ncbi:unnamed protein product [Taenia asiatica]|uniref:Ras-GAP domain-containing protein n=1 Tax=Taenia asiatica TaxID=60517 RepID=A0A158R9V9_TAEAS|nr:unnamed protein product [Taenia asiatica]